MTTEVVLALALGAFAIGALVVWVLRGLELRTVESKLALADLELSSLREIKSQVDKSRSAESELEKLLAAAVARVENTGRLENELAETRDKLNVLTGDKAALAASLESATKAHIEQVSLLTSLRQDVQDQFKLLAGDTLKATNEEFAKRAEDIFKTQKELTAQEIDKRSASIAELVKPLGESLKGYEEEIRKIEQVRNESYGGLKEAISAMREQHDDVRSVTASLVNALRASPKTRGRWAEHTLQRVMELSGLVEHCDFETEKHFSGDDESFRPDVVIQVAEGRTIIVDAKAPTSAYLDAVEAVDDEVREAHLLKHAGQLRERLNDLSGKSYWEKIPGSTDCVVMFVPGDNFVSAAFERDPSLFEDGLKNRVLICTPTTFIALAKALAYGWRQEKLRANANEVAKLGRELYLRLSTMTGHVLLVGKHLRDGVGAYNKFVGSLESRVLTQARRFSDLGVEGTSNEIEELTQIDSTVRVFNIEEPELSFPTSEDHES